MMKQFGNSLLLFIGIVLFVNCKPKNVITITSFPIEKSIEYSMYEPYNVIDPAQIAVSKNYLFLWGIKSDPIFQQYELQKLDYVQSFGQRGRGPCEYSSHPMMYTARDQEKLYIYRTDKKIFTANKILENGDLFPDREFEVGKNKLFNQFHIIKDSLLIHNAGPEIGIEIIDISTNKHSTYIEFTKNKHYKGEDYFHPDNGVLSVTNRYIIYAYIYRKQIDI